MPKKAKLITDTIDGEIVYYKKCTQCHKLKSLDKFNKDSKGVGGKQSKCKECVHINGKAYKNNLINKDKIGDWNRDKIKNSIISIYRQSIDLKKVYKIQTYRQLYDNAIRLFGSWQKAIESSGIDYEQFKPIQEEKLTNGNIIIKKKCSCCNQYKEIEDFWHRSNIKSGYSSYCKECERKKKQEWKTSNPDYYKSYYYKNHEHILLLNRKNSKKRYEKNHDKILEYKRKYSMIHRNYRMQWYKENKELYKHYRNKYKIKRKIAAHKRRTMIHKLPYQFSKNDYNSMIEYWGGKCCLSEKENNIVIDHFIPLCTGCGGTIKENLVPMNDSLNASKGGRNPFEWIKLHKEYIKGFNKTVSYLAKLNHMTNEEYKNYVYACFRE